MCPPSLIRFTAGFFLCLFAVTAKAADDDLLQRVRDGHRAARESVRTLTASITFEKTHPTKGMVEQGRYWRSGDTAHIQTGREGAHLDDILVKAGEIRNLGRHWDVKKPSLSGIAIRHPGDRFVTFCDAWREMLIEQSPPAGGLGLDRVLETADGPVRADEDKLDGNPCIRLRYTHLHGSRSKEAVSQWHDIGRNYLIRQIVSEYPESPISSRNVLRVTDFVEPSPGVVFPVRVQRDHYKNGELYETTVSTLTDVVINKPVPASALALPPVPQGTILKDYIENKEGPINSDWKPIGPMKPMAPRPVLPAERAPTAMPTETAQSAAEPVSFARWVIIGSIAVLLVTAMAAAARRIQLARRPATI